MRSNKTLFLAFFVCSSFTCQVFAADKVANSHITAAERTDVVAELDRRMKTEYVFPDVADKVAKALAEKAATGAYATADTTTVFAEMLSHDLQELGNDRHLEVSFKPDFMRSSMADTTPNADEVAEARQIAISDGYGIARVERLPGNVGYIDLRQFDPAEFVGSAYTAALTLLSGTDALILDLRRNGGGDPESVATLISHFFSEGDERHLNDIYDRLKDSTRQFWTSASVHERYTKPVYVLISSHTFSGGEECAYDLQTQKRAILVGGTTGGGANPGDRVALGHGFVAFIPFARTINPTTHTNWEHVGVRPDIVVPASKALQTAYAAILRTLAPQAADVAKHEQLQQILLRIESGESEQTN